LRAASSVTSLMLYLPPDFLRLLSA
jgi:hypothetical protein